MLILAPVTERAVSPTPLVVSLARWLIEPLVWLLMYQLRDMVRQIFIESK